MWNEITQTQHTERKTFVVRLALPLLLLSFTRVARAGEPATSATLTITMNLQSSISLVFDNNPAVGTAGFCSLSNAGTNDVGLDLGTASWWGGDSLRCVGFSRPGFWSYEVASGFDVVVTKANSASASYTLSAEISSAPPAGVTWLVNGSALNNTVLTTLDAGDGYDTPVTKTLQVRVDWFRGIGVQSETITFQATAN